MNCFVLAKLRKWKTNIKFCLGANPGNSHLSIWVFRFIFVNSKNGEWRPVEDRFKKKLASWTGKLLSYGDRLILVNSVLKSLPMFILSFFELPKGVWKRMDLFRSRFFWQSDGHKRKYRLAKWNILCRQKEQGGLGI